MALLTFFSLPMPASTRPTFLLLVPWKTETSAWTMRVHACSRRELVAETPSFYAASAWWFLAALSRGMLEFLGREWLAKLSLSVFAQRANYAHQVRRAIEKRCSRCSRPMEPCMHEHEHILP